MTKAVLLVEDDHEVREMMMRMLHLEGFAPVSAANGRAALEILESGAPIKVILLDLMMPVMDGWAFRREQRSDPRFADIPVIVLSAVEAERIREIEPLASFRKPLVFDEVIAFLHKLGVPR